MRRLALPLTLTMAVALTATAATTAHAAPADRDHHPRDITRQVLADGDGWGSAGDGTTGGSAAAGEDVVHVATLEELRAAVGPRDDDRPRIVVVEGLIDGNTAPDGSAISCADYAVDGYTQEDYLATYHPDVWGWDDPEGPLEEARAASQDVQAEQIRVDVGSNTTLVGADDDSELTGINLRVNDAENVILRNLTFSDAYDCFPGWDPKDGNTGNWNSEYDNIEISGSTNVWVDHNTFDDGENPGSELPEYFGSKYEMHDALLDIVRESDLVTVSYNHFVERDKAMIVGNSDGRTTDRGHLRITYHHNHFDGLGQRAPRVRFGQVHVYNNHYTLAGDLYQYALGAGKESQLVAENNVFDLHDGIGAGEIVYNWGGTDLVARGNAVMYEGRGRMSTVDLVAEHNELYPDRALGTEQTWTPEYVQRVQPVWAVRGLPRRVGAGLL
ncbi:polysaccharide lyase family 1 protein [Nocardiopsis sp. NRRL B-16309]|uniref:pectate lyase family protein n=1 Tax=Nocardiopsis sp. NRRL B-16309 TaxID=1519494 RepID=UPI0006AEF957|nr:pectate lyase [Nocardiopsis sp. NRRL B-16309]KOX16461.1 pectate lyase [Nocardiopsis sp. NRRL B-16309]